MEDHAEAASAQSKERSSASDDGGSDFEKIGLEAGPAISAENPKSTDSVSAASKGNAVKMRVLKCVGDAVETAVATLNSPWTTLDQAAKLKLSDLRDFLQQHLDFQFAYCLKDRSNVPDDLQVLDYFIETRPTPPQSKNLGAVNDAQNQVDQQIIEAKPNPNSSNATKEAQPVNMLYVKEKPVPKAFAVEVLKKSFIVRIVDLNGESQEARAVETSQLPKPTIKLQMKHIRPFTSMSRDNGRHEFCWENGTSVNDEMSFETYISKGPVPSDIESESPPLVVYYQKIR